MENNFLGKRALVTGAAQGIGLAIVKKLVSCGAKVVALDVKEEELKNNLKEAPWKYASPSNNRALQDTLTYGGMFPEVETVAVDLGNWNATLEVLKNIGQVELVVNNAGIHISIPNVDMEEAVVNRTFDVNVKAVMAVCKHVVNEMTSAGMEGAIVNIASTGATKSYTLSSPYCASKAALLQYTRCLALDCAPKGIRVNVVSPGITRTVMMTEALEDPEVAAKARKMVPMKEIFCEPEDIANAVAFLLCNKLARKITGVNLHVDSGLMLT